MPGITIIPGTFNPEATPAEVGRLQTFPRTVVATAPRRWMQFQTGGGKPAPPLVVSYPVDYVYYDLNSGEFQIGWDGPVDSSKTQFTLAGLRYVPDGIYTKIPFSAADPAASVAGIISSPPGDPVTSVDIGHIVVGSDTSYNNIQLRGGNQITLAGLEDTTYTYHPPGTFYSGSSTVVAGIIDAGIGISNFGGGTINSIIVFAIAPLKRGSVIYDRLGENGLQVTAGEKRAVGIIINN